MAETAAAQDYPSNIADVRQYARVLWARKWTIALVVNLTLIAALAFSLTRTPIYESRAQVLVSAVSLSSNVPAPALNMETERSLAGSVSVLQEGLQTAAIPGGIDAASRSLSVSVVSGTEILSFAYSDPDPERAQTAAQAFLDAYLDFRRQRILDELDAASAPLSERLQNLNDNLQGVQEQLRNTDDPDLTATLEARSNSIVGQMALLQERLNDLAPAENLQVGQVIMPASEPGSPASPKTTLNALLAIGFGIVAGIGLAFLRERLDDRLRGRQDLEAASGTPVLAAVPRLARWKKRDENILVTRSDPDSLEAESYRTLRTGLLFAASQTGIKTVLVTSPSAGEGKTTTAANLALSLAQAGRKVVLVSADLRRPRVERFFLPAVGKGLTHVLSKESTLEKALVPSGPDARLEILPSGPVPGNPAELLGSLAMREVVDTLRDRADFVLIDAAPVLAVADALTLTSLSDGVLLVADASTTTRDSVEHARRELSRVHANIMGAVLNNFDPSKARGYGHYGATYYGSRGQA